MAWVFTKKLPVGRVRVGVADQDPRPGDKKILWASEQEHPTNMQRLVGELLIQTSGEDMVVLDP